MYVWVYEQTEKINLVFIIACDYALLQGRKSLLANLIYIGLVRRLYCALHMGLYGPIIIHRCNTKRKRGCMGSTASHPPERGGSA